MKTFSTEPNSEDEDSENIDGSSLENQGRFVPTFGHDNIANFRAALLSSPELRKEILALLNREMKANDSQIEKLC